MNKEIEIPEGYEAKIEGNKIIIKPINNEDEKQKEQKKPVDLVAELKHHLETTPKEQLEKEWKELEPWGKIGPTVKEFLYGRPVECDKETDIQKAFREGQNAGRQEVFDNPWAYGFEKIDNVFGFRIGDKVRLVDGDGRPHIIKMFVKIEGLHGQDFYRVVFEDNTASCHIFEYPNGYIARIEKVDEQKEQKPAEEHYDLTEILVPPQLSQNLAIGDSEKPVNREDLDLTSEELDKISHALFNTYAVDSATFLVNKIKTSSQPNNQHIKWGEGEQKVLDTIIKDYEDISKSFCGNSAKIEFLKSLKNGEYGLPNTKSSQWSEEDDQLIGFIFDLLNVLVWRKDWAMSKEECLERLKSLHQQHRW